MTQIQYIKKNLRSDHAVWEPGLRREEMERDLPLHLLRLVADLRDGDYRPAPLRRFPIAKADGRQRVLSALTLRALDYAARIMRDLEMELNMGKTRVTRGGPHVNQLYRAAVAPGRNQQCN